MELSEFFEKHVPAGTVLGIVGCGKCGEELLHYALEHKAEVLLCDPPRAEAESEEEWSNTCELWGNGMGGKVYDRDEFLTFLPLDYLLKHAHILCILVPENTVLFTEEMIQKIPSSMKIFNFSGEGIFLRKHSLIVRKSVFLKFPSTSRNKMQPGVRNRTTLRKAVNKTPG